MLELKEDIEVWDTIEEAVGLLEYVIDKYNIKSLSEFQCPHMRGLAKELFSERVQQQESKGGKG